MNRHKPPLRQPSRPRGFDLRILALPALLALLLPSFAAPTSPQALLAQYTAEAGRAPVPAQGHALFTRTQGREWSCSSCHGATPTQTGRHAGTGKLIDALAPAANPARFSESAKSEKWFARNCKDVLGRECSAGEKADVLAWLISLR